MKKKRLKFAEKHVDWSAQDWKKVLFSDESIFQQLTVGKNHIRRPMGERFDAKYTISTVKHPPTKIIWGAMCANGTAGIYFLKHGTIMNCA